MVQMLAVTRDSFMLNYIIKPSEAVQLAAVKQQNSIVQHIEKTGDYWVTAG